MANDFVLKYRDAQIDRPPIAVSLSTRDVQRYFQGRLDVLVAAMKKTDPEKYKNLGSIKVQVGATQASDNFYPILVMLPTSALESNVSTSTGDDIPSIYFSHDEDDAVRLIPEIMNFFKIYSFSKKDKENFTDPRWISKFGTSRRIGAALANLTTPRYKRSTRPSKDGDVSVEYIHFCIDPIQVFHDMVCGENEDPKTFKIEIDRVEKIKHGEYKYHVKRIKKKNDDSMNDIFFKDAEAMFRRNS